MGFLKSRKEVGWKKPTCDAEKIAFIMPSKIHKIIFWYLAPPISILKLVSDYCVSLKSKLYIVTYTHTLMLEKMVPKSKKSILGSLETMSFLEKRIQIVVIMNRDIKGIKGRMALMNGLIFPVRFL